MGSELGLLYEGAKNGAAGPACAIRFVRVPSSLPQIKTGGKSMLSDAAALAATAVKSQVQLKTDDRAADQGRSFSAHSGSEDGMARAAKVMHHIYVCHQCGQPGEWCAHPTPFVWDSQHVEGLLRPHHSKRLFFRRAGLARRTHQP